MVKKKKHKKASRKTERKTEVKEKKAERVIKKELPSLDIKKDSDIAMDFASKVYQKFDKIIKSVVLFGSVAKQTAIASSDIDIVVIIDDVSIKWDQELIAWYREELEKIIKAHPYKKSLHINTIKLSTWWQDLMRGDPVVLNILRYGEPVIDLAGFFEPLKYLLLDGKIKSTPEAIYSALQRAPMHIIRSRTAELSAIEGVYWAMVDSSHAALIAANLTPASPEHIPIDLKETFVDKGKLKMKYVIWYRDLLMLYKKISHGEIRDLKGVEIDAWQQRAEEFLEVMAKLVKDLIEQESVKK